PSFPLRAHLLPSPRVSPLPPPPPLSTLFPYTTLFRSLLGLGDWEQRWTDRTPLGRVGEPTDIADVVVFLCSDLARYITGQVLVRSEEHTSELQSRVDLVCRLLLEKKNECKMVKIYTHV